MSSVHRLLLVSVVGLEVVASPAFAQSPGAASQVDLSACAAISTTAERLACYDKLAAKSATKSSTSAQPTSATPAASSSSASTAPTSSAASSPARPASSAPPSAASGSASLPASGAVSISAPGSASSPAPAESPAAGTGTPAVGTREAFGLNALEHPAAPKSTYDSIKATVASVGYDAYGRETVTMVDGPVWSLAGSDPILAKGDTVTIDRAALGSFVMTTPSGRSHRVKRLR